MRYIELADNEMDNYIARSDELGNRLLTLENQIEELRAKATAITEANKRAELEK